MSPSGIETQQQYGELGKLIKLLDGYVSEHQLSGGGFDANHDLERRSDELFAEMKVKELENTPSLSSIPRFYKASHPHALSRQILRKMARRMFLQSKTDELILSEEELAQVATLLTEHATPPHNDQRDRISYTDFLAVGKLVSPRASRYFASWVFFLLPRDGHFRIGTHLLFHYICLSMAQWQTRIQLSVHDTTGCGYLREQDLESYIYSLIPNLPSLNDLQDNFYPYYVFTAVRKFFFFLDPKRTGRISIKTILSSAVLEDLLQLQQTQGYDEEAEVSNWFSASNALRVYTQYLELDRDHNGMLSKEELAMFGRGSLTDLIVDRIFEECHTYDGEMDYKTFLDFILAMENKQTPQGASYFFHLLDIKCVGYLDIFAINCFFREIVKRLGEEDGDVVRVEDVKDEIFDMCTPAHPHRITLQDLLNCQMADTIITMLTDLSGFWAYDNRETLIAEEYMEQDADDEQQQVVPQRFEETNEPSFLSIQPPKPIDASHFSPTQERPGTPMPSEDIANNEGPDDFAEQNANEVEQRNLQFLQLWRDND